MTALVRFFAFNARVSAPRWLAWFALAIGIMWLGIEALGDAEGAVLVAVYAGLGIVAAKLATETVRRLHDRGQSGWVGLPAIAGVVALIVTAVLRWLGQGPDPVAWGALGLAVVAIAILLLRPGIDGANAYGPPPMRLSANEGTADKTGLSVAIGILIAAIGVGLAVLAWQAGLAREREARMRHADRYVAPPNLFPGVDETPVEGENAALANENAATSDRIDALLNQGSAR